jgi:hypothetical protein
LSKYAERRIVGFRHEGYEEGASRQRIGRTTYTQPLARSAADYIESEAIAHRAYELFEERGRGEGREFDDWLHAEHELRELNDDNTSE